MFQLPSAPPAAIACVRSHSPDLHITGTVSFFCCGGGTLVVADICGLPAVSIPCGFDEKNLPIGMQLIGNRFAEANILNLAWQFEQATQGQFNKKVEGGLAL